MWLRFFLIFLVISISCEAQNIYTLPIVAKEGVHVLQGPLNEREGSSHNLSCCLHAIDLFSEAEPGTIVAAESGVVYQMHTGCVPAEFQADLCGDGFGNWIGIWHDNGELSLYAHLAEVFVEVGQQVKKGEPIGIEGATGNCGWPRHLHFCIHRADYSQYPPYYNETIPYYLHCVIEGKEKIVDVLDYRNLDWDRDMTSEPKLYSVSQ